ncbi:hypothetical protein C2E20_2632 [Micractinium conductrix]|uniref:C2H2-type domain-containing protein n=1 Tax=Micractinium conductrix TaxID=554055 RepID=A0A2P6VJC1_9CHLO|nr:hypothetical protein C2E20_2632 [Micractinium conductrix]|eukprot:PSC74160.1 hypothetical protein C2E20_2632 [Micractinium conductrix]
MLRCGECEPSKQFRTPAALLQHVVTKHPRVWSPADPCFRECDVCEREFSAPVWLDKHVREVHLQQQQGGLAAAGRARDPFRLPAHKRSGAATRYGLGSDRPDIRDLYTCFACDHALMEHQAPADLLAHLRQAGCYPEQAAWLEGARACPDCGRAFGSFQALSSHVAAKHLAPMMEAEDEFDRFILGSDWSDSEEGAGAAGGGRRPGIDYMIWLAQQEQTPEELEERMENCGFTHDEAYELLCQGVKPWDNDAWDVLAALSKAVVIAEDRSGKEPQRLLGVRTADGRLVHVQTTQAQLANIHSGMRVKVSGSWQRPAPAAAGGAALAAAPAAPACTFAAATIQASGAAFAAPTLTRPLTAAGGAAVAATAGVAEAGVLSTNALVAADLSTIVIPIAGVSKPGTACPGTQLPLASVDAVRKAVLPELNPAGITVGSTYNKCSYGKSSFTAANSQVANLVQLPCNGVTNGVAWTFSKCDFDDFNGYADAADAALAARGIDLSRFKHRVYLIPPGQCGFVGLGYIGCDGSYTCRSWIGADFWATPQAIVHEMGHNLYMGHAGATNSEGVFDEYADDSGTMGYCCQDRCPNTPHAWQLGWISVRQLDGASLKPGVPVTLTVASQALSSQSGLRIVPSWAAGVDPIFVGYRTKASGDAALEPQLAGRLHLYTAGITNTYDPKLTSWKGSLSTAGTAWTHPTAGMVVRLKAAGGTAASVTLCRKAGKETLASCLAGLDNDCNGLVGAKDPACAALVRRRRAAVRRPTMARAAVP